MYLTKQRRVEDEGLRVVDLVDRDESNLTQHVRLLTVPGGGSHGDLCEQPRVDRGGERCLELLGVKGA